MRRVPLVLAAVALLLLLALRRWLIPATAVSRQPAANFRWRTAQFGRASEEIAAALEIDDSLPEAYLVRGELRVRSGAVDDAEDAALGAFATQ